MVNKPDPNSVGTNELRDKAVTNSKIRSIDSSKVTYRDTTVEKKLTEIDGEIKQGAVYQ